MIKPGDILERKFDKSGLKGYKPEEVDDYLSELAGEFQILQEENAELQSKIIILAERIEEYRSDEENLKNAIISAQKLATSIVDDAKKKSSQILEDAQNKSSNLLSESQKQHDDMLSSIESNYNKEVEKLQANINDYEYAYEEIKSTVANFKIEMLDMCRKYTSLVNDMPSFKSTKCFENSVNKSLDLENIKIKEDEDINIEESDFKSVSLDEFPEIDDTQVSRDSDFSDQVSRDNDYIDNVINSLENEIEKNEKENTVSQNSEEFSFNFSGIDNLTEDTADITKIVEQDDSKFGKLKFGSDYEIKRDKSKR